MARRRTVLIVVVIAALLVVGMGGLAGARSLRAGAASVAASQPQAHAAKSAAAQSAVPTLPAATLTGHLWTLMAFTYHGNPQRIARGLPVTLRFLPDIHTLGGRSGCNEYGATYALNALTPSHIQISGVNYTQMACRSVALMTQEQRYREAIPLLTTYHLDQAGLTLSDGVGAYVLRFA